MDCLLLIRPLLLSLSTSLRNQFTTYGQQFYNQQRVVGGIGSICHGRPYT